jgi:predicted ATPase
VREVRDALGHLYDLPYLQTHPLAARAGGGKALRQLLEDTVASLSGPGRLAVLLRLRYVDGLEPADVWTRLAISKSEYYHAHRRALTAVAEVLAERSDLVSNRTAEAPSTVTPTAWLPVPLSSFVGREREVADLRRLLLETNVRLVTISGPPGAGKSRIALALAGELGSAFPDGVAFVALAPLSDPALVPASIAAALGLRAAELRMPLEGLKRHLRGMRMLLLLDNFEQVVAAAPALAELLSACPRLIAVATSREALGVRGEQQYALAPLPLEAATRLFLDRAHAVQPGFAPAVEDEAVVAELCRRLDGLPLAIELAAARARVFAPTEILAHLRTKGGRLALLTGGARDALPHQQTLVDAIAWSYDLLQQHEKTLFRRLGVFVGGFTIDAAEAVSSCLDWETLASLVEKSLVQPEAARPGAVSRFTMLETVREYALVQLTAAEEEADALQLHANYYLGLAEAANRVSGSARGAVFERLERATPDLRAALRRALDRDDLPVALGLAAALAGFWRDRAHDHEGRTWLAEVLAQAGARAPELRAVRARALVGLGWLAFRQGDHAAIGWFKDALADAAALGDDGLAAEARLGVGQVRQAAGDYAGACAALASGLATYRAVGDPYGVAHALFLLGMLASRQAETGLARTHLNESLEIARSAGDRAGVARALGPLALLAFQRGDLGSARALYEEGLAADRAIGDRRSAAWRELSLARVLHSQGDRAGARELYEQATATLRALGERARALPEV